MLTGNNKGVSLVEMLAAVAILMVGAMGVATVSKLTTEKIKYDTAKTNEASLGRLLRAQLEFSDQCATRLQFTGTGRLRTGNRNQRRNLTTSPIRIQVPGLLNGQGGDWVQAGTVIASGLTVRNLSLYNAQPIPNSYNPPDDTTAEYLVNIRLTYDYDRDNDGVADTALLGGTSGRAVELGSIVLGVQGSQPNNPNINNNLNIVSCHGVGTTSSSEDICTSLNCRWSNGQCSCATPSFDCPPGTLLTGFQAGRGVCEDIGGSCPSGQYLVGVEIGRASCRDLPIYDPGVPPVGGGTCLANGEQTTMGGQLCGTTGITTGIPASECCSGTAREICYALNEPSEVYCSGGCTADGNSIGTYNTGCFDTCYLGYSQECILNMDPNTPPPGYSCTPEDATRFCQESCGGVPDYSSCCSGTGYVSNGQLICGSGTPPTPTPTPTPTPSPAPTLPFCDRCAQGHSVVISGRSWESCAQHYDADQNLCVVDAWQSSTRPMYVCQYIGGNVDGDPGPLTFAPQRCLDLGDGMNCDPSQTAASQCTFDGQVLRTENSSCCCANMGLAGGYTTKSEYCRSDGSGGYTVEYSCATRVYGTYACSRGG